MTHTDSFLSCGPSRFARFNEKLKTPSLDRNNKEKIRQHDLHRERLDMHETGMDMYMQGEKEEYTQNTFKYKEGSFKKDQKSEGGFCPAHKRIWKIAYDDEIEKIKIEHPDWTDSQVRHEGVVNIRLRYRSDTDSIRNERSDMETYEATKFVWDDEKGVRYTSGGYDTGIEDFHENQKRLTPDEYSLEDHLTSKAINEAFRNGATTVVTSYYREGQDHRDILIMRLDPVTKEGTTTVINTATDGNCHTFDGIMDIAKQQFDTLHTVQFGTKTALLVDKAIAVEHIARPLAEVQEHYHLWKTHRDAQVVRETHKEFVVRKFTKDGMREPSFTKKKFDELTKSSSRGEHVLPKYPYQMKEFHMKPKSEHGSKMNPSSEGKIPDMFHTLHTAHQSMQEKRKSLRFIKETNVGVASSLFFIRALSKEPPVILTKKEKKILHKREQKHRFLQKQRETKNSIAFVERKKMRQGEKRGREKKRHRLLFGTEVFVKDKKEKVSVLFGEKVILRKEKKKKKRKEHRFHKEMLKKDLKETKRKETRLYEFFGKVTRMIIRIEQKQRHLLSLKEKKHRPKESKKQIRLERKKMEQRMHILRFVEHLVLFRLLQSERIHTIGVQKNSTEKREQQKEKSETVWVLLSIIWYMTMIREQGLIQYQPKKKKKKQQKKKNYGVIFDSRMRYVPAQSYAIML